jgi:hypothetical protein
MTNGKLRSRQQQIDDKALGILKYKFPEGFVFREQEKDFGMDCEFEQFQQIHLGTVGLQASTGIIFKAQVKGVEDGSKLELKTKPVLSKAFETRDLEYWYEQIRTPVIIFLVDLKTEAIYWIEFYSSKKLRDDYLAAKQNGQQFVNIHFNKMQTIPETVNSLLEAVNNAQQRIALSLLPGLRALEEHLRENPDIEQEIRILERRRELAYYHRFLKHLDEDNIDQANTEAIEILQNSEFSPTTKLYTVLAAGKIVYATDAERFRKDDPFTHILGWQVKALQEYACTTTDTPPLVKQTTDLMRCILNIRVLGNDIFNDRVAAEVFALRDGNPIALLSLPLIYAREAVAFGVLREVIEEYNEIAAREHDLNLQLRVTSLTAPMLAQALIPFRQTYLLAQETEKLKELDSYVLGILKTHAAICEWLSDEGLIHQCLVSIVSMSAQPSEEEPGFSAAREIVSTIADPEFRDKAEAILKDLIDYYEQAFKPMQPPNEMQMRKEVALRLAEMQGYDLEKDSQDVGYEDEINRGIHDVLRHGIEELDLTEYLKDCQHRHIYKPEFSGVSPVADAFGLGFAASRKSVVCLKKRVFANLVGYYLKDTFGKFYDDHCANCPLAKPHSEDWQYSYDWQRDQDDRLKEMRKELDKKQGRA